MSRHTRTLLIALAIFLGMAGSVSATTYYIDFSTGNDSNSGTSTSSPWKHAPGMTGATGNAASYSCRAGDKFYLDGGVTWDYTVLPWTWTCSGTSGARVYVGGDPSHSYYNSTKCSAAGYPGYCRPIIDGGGATGCSGSPCYDTTTKHFFSVNYDSYLDVEWLEFTGLYWGGSPAFSYAFYVEEQESVTNTTFQDNYFHGWSHAAYPTATEGEGCCAVVLGNTGVNNDLTDVWSQNVIDGSDTSKDSFGASYGGPGVWIDNYINYAWSDTFNGSYCDIYGNTIMNTGISFAAAGGIHDNTFESNTDCNRGMLFYDNYFAHVMANSGGDYGITFQAAPQATAYIFNNVMVDTNPAGGNNLICTKPLVGSAGTCTYFNDTVECGYDSSVTSPCGTGYGTISHVINMHFITSGSYTFKNAGSGATLDYTTDIAQTKSAANAQGYNIDQTYPFSSTSGSNATVGSGTNEAALCTAITALDSAAGAACMQDSTLGVGYDATNHAVIVPTRSSTNARPGAGAGNWDVGAYEFGSGAVSGQPSPPSNLIAVIQ